MRSRLIAAAIAAASMPASASAEVISFGHNYPEPAPPRGEYRKGRRHNYGFGPMRRGGNPAGTKLAKQAAKGLLTKCRIR